MVERPLVTVTVDSLFDGDLIVHQDKDGYRFSLDAVLLAGLTGVRSDDRVMDLGTGCGVVLLILAYRKQGRRLVGLEIQPELAALAGANVQVNGFMDRIEIRELDYRQVASRFPGESFDLVLSNPPYRLVDSGRINPHPQRALARHELAGSVSDVFTAGGHLLRRGGRLAIIYPAARMDHLMTTAHEHGFVAKDLTMIHSRMGEGGRLVHVEYRKGGGRELRVAPPFFIYREDRTYTKEMQDLHACGHVRGR